MADFQQFFYAVDLGVFGRFEAFLAVPGPPRAQIRVPRVRAVQNGLIGVDLGLI